MNTVGNACPVAILLFLALCIGCNSGEYKLVPVSGTVTLDGEPVSNARVIFEPRRVDPSSLTAGPSSDGETDESGKFSLATTADGKSGAIAGTHDVVVTTYLAEIDRETDSHKVVRKEQIPQRYLEPGGLTFEIPADGTDAADLMLTTSPSKNP